MSAVTLNHPLAKLPMYGACACVTHTGCSAHACMLYMYTRVCVWSVSNTCIHQQKPDAPSRASPPLPRQLTSMFLQKVALVPRGSGTARCSCGACLAACGAAHRVPAPGVCDQQTGVTFDLKQPKKIVGLQMYLPGFVLLWQ